MSAPPTAIPDFEAFVLDRSAALVRAGWLLTGDWAGAEDLVQTALAHAWPKWSTIEHPEAYVRRAMVRQYVSWRRRKSAAERVVDTVPDDAAAAVTVADGVGGTVVVGPERSDLGLDVRNALAGLGKRQRAAVVLRYFLDLSEADTAAAMGVSTGTVKSTVHKALAALRTSPLLADAAEGR